MIITLQIKIKETQECPMCYTLLNSHSVEELNSCRAVLGLALRDALYDRLDDEEVIKFIEDITYEVE